MKILLNNKWVDGKPNEGELYLTTSGATAKSGGYAGHVTPYPAPATDSELKLATETQWQDSELKKYDSKLQPDRPNAARILEYRQELRDYILHADFPNGTRPVL